MSSWTGQEDVHYAELSQILVPKKHLTPKMVLAPKQDNPQEVPGRLRLTLYPLLHIVPRRILHVFKIMIATPGTSQTAKEAAGFTSTGA